MDNETSPRFVNGTLFANNRKANLKYLVLVHGSQTDLASAIVGSGITQPMISEMVRNKRAVREYEARTIEKCLRIPAFWMDRALLRDCWRLLAKFRTLSSDTIDLFDELQVFMNSRFNRVPVIVLKE